MEKQTIFQAMNNVEKNISTIFTKQDVINLLHTIDVDKTIENSDAQYWKKSSYEWQKLYEDEAERRQETIAYNDLCIERIADIKHKLWRSSTGMIDVFDNEENYDDISFCNNIDKEYKKKFDDRMNDSGFVNYRMLYDNFREITNRFEFNDVVDDYQLCMNGNEVYIDSCDVNVNEICQGLDRAYDDYKDNL